MAVLAHSVVVDGELYAAGSTPPAGVADRIRTGDAWVGGTAPALSAPRPTTKADIGLADLTTPSRALAALGLGSAALLDSSQVGAAAGGVVNAKAVTYGAVGDGTTDDRAALAAADTAAGDLLLPAGTYRVSSNLTLASPVTFAGGAKLKPDSGARVTLTGRLTAPLAQIFDLSAGGTVTVTYGNNGDAVPQWWGVLPDTGTSQSAAMTAMLASMVSQNRPLVVQFGAGTWRLDAGFTIDPTFVSLRGRGPFQTALDFTNMSTGTAITVAKLNGDNRRHMVLDGFAVEGPTGAGTTVDGMLLGGTSTYANQCGFARTRFNGFRDATTFTSNSWAISFRECSWRNAARRDLYCATGGANYGENYSFHDCSLFGGTATGLEAAAGGFSFYATSFDYFPRAMDLSGTARVNTYGCWFETGDAQANGATEFVRLSTTNSYSCSLTIHGGTLHPAYTSTGTYATFVRITGTSGGNNHTALDIDGLYIDSTSAANVNYLVYDDSTATTDSNTHNSGEVTIRALRYQETTSGGNWPWRYRDRAGKVHNLAAGMDLGNLTVDHLRGAGSWARPTIHFVETLPRSLARDKIVPVNGDFYLVAIPEPAGGISFSQYEVLSVTGAAGSVSTFLTLGVWTLASGTLSRFNASGVTATSGNQFRGATITQNGQLPALGAGKPVFLGVHVSVTGGTAAELRGMTVDAANPLLGQASTASVMSLVAGKLTGQASVPTSFALSSLATPDFIPWLAFHPLAY